MNPPRRLIILVTLALTASIPLHAQDAPAPQTWTATDGRVVQATFIKLDGESVVIKKDGQQFSVPFAMLNPASLAQAKTLGGIAPAIAAVDKGSAMTFDPAGTEPIEPLWILPAEAFDDPEFPGKDYRLAPDSPYSTKSGDLIFRIGGTNEEPGQGVALVNGKTGKLLWRTSFNDRPEGTMEWGRGCKGGPDGHIYQWSVTSKKAEGSKRERALLHLRKLDASTGKILGHLKMAMDDPKSSEEPDGVVSTGSDMDIAVDFTPEHVLVANAHFFAEVDLDLSKVLRSTLLPEKWRDNHQYTDIDPKGGYAFWYSDPGERMEKLFALPGEEAREVPPTTPGWKVVGAQSWEVGGHILVQCQSPDEQSWAVGSYDVGKDSWAWVKSNTDWEKTVPGESKNLAESSFDGRILSGEKYEGKWVIDADNGDLRYRPPGYDEMMFLTNGKIWVIPSEYQVKNGRANEALLINSADGTVEATLPRTAPFPEARMMVKMPLGPILMAAVTDGTVELEVMSAEMKTIYPPRKIALDVPSAPSSVRLRTYGVDDITAAVMKISCSDGKEYFCAIPLPSK